MITVLLLAILATSLTPGDEDGPRTGQTRQAPDATPRKRTPMVNGAVATALNRRSRDIEIVVVGDFEDGVPGGTNVVELGRVSYRPQTATAGRSGGRRSEMVTIIRRMVTVRIGTGRTGFAPLRASLQADDARCRIRVDGKTLTVVPQAIDPLAPLGQPVAHVLEIEIATTAAEGPVSASISWTSDPP
jgi:hypothetical protein